MLSITPSFDFQIQVPRTIITSNDPYLLASYFTFLTTFLGSDDQKKFFDSYVSDNTNDLSIFSSFLSFSDRKKVNVQFLDLSY